MLSRFLILWAAAIAIAVVGIVEAARGEVIASWSLLIVSIGITVGVLPRVRL